MGEATKTVMEEEKKGKVVKEKVGDPFKVSSSTALAHCVSKGIQMSDGIATKFQKEFGCIEKLRKQRAKVGEVAILEHGDRFIYNLITKEKRFGMSTMDSLRSSLRIMRNHMEEKGVKKVAMPRCGFDNMDWVKVKVVLEEVFHGSAVKVIVYTLETKKERKKLPHLAHGENQIFKCKEGLKCPWINGEKGQRCPCLHPESPTTTTAKVENESTSIKESVVKEAEKENKTKKGQEEMEKEEMEKEVMEREEVGKEEVDMLNKNERRGQTKPNILPVESSSKKWRQGVKNNSLLNFVMERKSEWPAPHKPGDHCEQLLLLENNRKAVVGAPKINISLADEEESLERTTTKRKYLKTTKYNPRSCTKLLVSTKEKEKGKEIEKCETEGSIKKGSIVGLNTGATLKKGQTLGVDLGFIENTMENLSSKVCNTEENLSSRVCSSSHLTLDDVGKTPYVVALHSGIYLSSVDKKKPDKPRPEKKRAKKVRKAKDSSHFDREREEEVNEWNKFLRSDFYKDMKKKEEERRLMKQEKVKKIKKTKREENREGEVIRGEDNNETGNSQQVQEGGEERLSFCWWSLLLQSFLSFLGLTPIICLLFKGGPSTRVLPEKKDKKKEEKGRKEDTKEENKKKEEKDWKEEKYRKEEKNKNGKEDQNVKLEDEDIKKEEEMIRRRRAKRKRRAMRGSEKEEKDRKEEKDTKEEKNNNGKEEKNKNGKEDKNLKHEEDIKKDEEIKMEEEMIRRRRAKRKRRAMRGSSRRRRRQAAAKRKAHSRKTRQLSQKSDLSQHSQNDNDDRSSQVNSSCDEQRRKESLRLLLVISGVEQNPGPGGKGNIAKEFGWDDENCYGRSGPDLWEFERGQQREEKEEEAREFQKRAEKEARDRERKEMQQRTMIDALCAMEEDSLARKGGEDEEEGIKEAQSSTVDTIWPSHPVEADEQCPWEKSRQAEKKEKERKEKIKIQEQEYWQKILDEKKEKERKEKIKIKEKEYRQNYPKPHPGPNIQQLDGATSEIDEMLTPPSRQEKQADLDFEESIKIVKMKDLKHKAKLVELKKKEVARKKSDKDWKRCRDENEVRKRTLQNNLTRKEIKEVFNANKEFLENIKRGKVYSSRDEQFKESTESSKALGQLNFTHIFNPDQFNWVCHEVDKTWEEREYNWAVLIPEFVVSLYAHFFKTTREDAKEKIEETRAGNDLSPESSAG